MPLRSTRRVLTYKYLFNLSFDSQSGTLEMCTRLQALLKAQLRRVHEP